MHLLLGSQEKLLSLEGEFPLEHSFGFCSSLSAPIPRLTGLEWWHTVGGVTLGSLKTSYLHGMKLAMVTRSGGWNPGPH